ncbi:TPM domain-containing protein [Paucibacter soli]|uniref:TPM domain-containing protein n=1 Tax=Paucibacter soli TaxID=3133433 RepID=UPI0030A42185
MRRWLLLLLWAFSSLALPALAQELRPVPVLTAQVIDQTGTLSAAQRSALEAKLAKFEQESGAQLVILMVASSAPEDIAAYAQRVGDAWKLGRREVGDGLLIVVAKDDRKLRIEVAKALEGAVPDLAARQIIQQVISPAFKAGDYAGGLNLGVDALAARIRGEALPAPAAQRAPAQDLGLGIEDWGAIIFIGVPILGAALTAIFGRKLGSLLTAGGAGALAWLLSTSLLVAAAAALVSLLLVGVMGVGAARRGIGRNSHGGPVIWGGGGFGGGSSSGGGGFSSGGGGDFGGGGASGDW